MSVVTAPGIRVDNGTLSAMKWLALALMVVDHVDAFVYGRTDGWMMHAGRLVVPLFGFVLAYNLARPDALERGVHRRLLQRLAVFGLAAWPFYALLRGVALPLNIMATLAAAVGVVWCIERGRQGWAVAIFVVGGALGEYWWPGVGLVVATWAFLRAPSALGLGWVALCFACLSVINGSHAAVWAVPVVLAACYLRPTLPRCQWLFWTFYPAHLAAFFVWRTIG